MNLKIAAGEWAETTGKSRSRAGDEGNPKIVETRQQLEGTEITCNPLDPPPEEDRKGAIPIAVDDEGICRRENPKGPATLDPLPLGQSSNAL
jgi:hypothetical protein